MLKEKKIIVVMPAYNAENTLEKTFSELPFDIIDEIVLVDDDSSDKTISIGKKLGIRHILKHEKNKGYGANQKTCYAKALELGADIIVMLHPDYQYTPLLITPMVTIIASGLYPVVFASRILGNGALKGGMPVYKYISNRILTLFQNLIMGQKLSEYHTGFRAYSSDVLKKIKFEQNSDDFVFDNQVIAQIFDRDYEIAEVTCPAKYFPGASSINFSRSLKYGLGVVITSLRYFLHKSGLLKWRLLR
ncbi:MAG: glycosyltransferase family 2 protein [Ignavibacteria bacterium]|nr:glycosyltransferase family 2 protein [Ignavibacteria bacterium]MCC7159578.1 glycosyltransferase family 2 protein [Ignavibacteria bacterium]